MIAKPSCYAPLAKRQRGNILFLILLAVVLFAALSYAVTSSINGGAKDISDEKAATIAAQIINSIGLQENELMRFMERKNLKIHQIDFTGTLASSDGSGNSPNCASSDCDFWHANGGGVQMPALPVEAGDPNATTSYCATGPMYRMSDDRIRPYLMVISVSGVGTEASDLVLFYHCVHPKICAEINIREGLRQRNGTPIVSNNYGNAPANFNKLSASSADGLPDTTANRTAGTETRVMSRRIWCSETTASPTGTQLYSVLYAR